ncbi:MAG: hypothetical protein EOP35_08485 [Rubrivivax sp.]|nr:MAG: hypothetical protein EOP35_08485 [Rubrivivax sp.]
MPTGTRSFPATQPIDPPTSARARVLQGGSTRAQPARATPAATRPQPAAGPRASGAAVKPDALPRWAKGVVIGGVLLAVAMPATVLMSRSMLVQEALAAESGSKAAMVCTGGDARAVDDSSIVSWLFGGSFFSCGDWETREARVQRDRDRAEANYLARQRSRQQTP